MVLDNHVIESNTILGEESFCCSERSSHKNDNGNYHFDFKNEQLELLFNSLTEKQQTITTLSYGLCLKDYEIGRLLNITQQAVSKTRNLIIKRLRRSLSEKAL
ncbi:hypothetical protein [Paenibacillus chibensis]|uniref:hypothetical protein n=1 Tax=Paenibacillus chibensis TaxID=59846 RepID=UPI003D2C0AAA